MKKLTIILGLILIVAQASWAQTFSIQGVLKNQYGKTLPDGYYAVTFSLYDAQTGGSALWRETLPSLQTQNGMFETELGAVNPFGSLAFDQNYWLGVAVEDHTEMPRMKLLNMPYSFAAKGVQNRFPSSGNVGIGVTEPESRLSVSGAGETYVTVQSSGAEAGYVFAENGDNKWVMKRVAADSTLRIAEAGVGDALTVHPGGNVGIGTDEPVSKIHVGGGDLTVEGELTSDSDEGGLWIGDSHFVGGDGADKLGIRTGDEWSLTVTPEGKVGIGAPDPATALEVAGNIKISGDGAIVFPDTTAIASLYSDLAAQSVTNPGHLLIHADSDADGTGGHQFRTGNETQMVFTNDGKLGVGTTNPQSRLEVAGDINFSGEVTENGTPLTTSPWTPEGNKVIYSDGHVGIGMENPTYTLNVNGYVNADKIYIKGKEVVGTPWRNPVASNPNYIWYSGRARIGPTQMTPDYDAGVQLGNLRAGNWFVHWQGNLSGWKPTSSERIGSSGALWGSVIVYRGYYDNLSQLSDHRTKRNIRPIANGLESVMRLSGTRYAINTETHPWYKGKSDEFYASINEARLTDNLGFVAQELREVLPELVKYDEESGYYQVQNVHQILPVITEAIKDLNAENEALEERIGEIEAGIQKLKGEK